MLWLWFIYRIPVILEVCWFGNICFSFPFLRIWLKRRAGCGSQDWAFLTDATKGLAEESEWPNLIIILESQERSDSSKSMPVCACDLSLCSLQEKIVYCLLLCDCYIYHCIIVFILNLFCYIWTCKLLRVTFNWSCMQASVNAINNQGVLDR